MPKVSSPSASADALSAAARCDATFLILPFPVCGACFVEVAVAACCSQVRRVERVTAGYCRLHLVDLVGVSGASWSTYLACVLVAVEAGCADGLPCSCAGDAAAGGALPLPVLGVVGAVAGVCDAVGAASVRAAAWCLGHRVSLCCAVQAS